MNKSRAHTNNQRASLYEIFPVFRPRGGFEYKKGRGARLGV